MVVSHSHLNGACISQAQTGSRLSSPPFAQRSFKCPITLSLHCHCFPPFPVCVGRESDELMRDIQSFMYSPRPNRIDTDFHAE